MTTTIKTVSGDQFGGIENAKKTYASIENAEAAVHKALDGCWMDARGTVVCQPNSKGRFVPSIFWQGKDATQACINAAHMGFNSFA